MKFGNDFKYDLKVGQVKERELGDIFENKKIVSDLINNGV